MNRPQDKNWLDGAISNTAPGKPPEADFQAWSKQNPQALAFLQERALDEAGSPTEQSAMIQLGRRIMRSPITKIAVAAILIVGVLFLTLQLMGQDRVPPSPDQNIAKESVTPIPQPVQVPKTTQVKPITELELARSLFEQRDQQGLLTLLASGEAGTRIGVAEYLGEIGDETAMPALQRLADSWQGPRDENPFQRAIDQIRLRILGNQGVIDPKPTSPGESPVSVKKAIPTTFVTGQVLDKTTLSPITGARVILRPSQTVVTNREGRFRLPYLKGRKYVDKYVELEAKAAGYASQGIALRDIVKCCVLRIFGTRCAGLFLLFIIPASEARFMGKPALPLRGVTPWLCLPSGFGWGVFEKAFSLAEGDPTSFDSCVAE